MSLTEAQRHRNLIHEQRYKCVNVIVNQGTCDSLRSACDFFDFNYSNLYAYIKRYHPECQLLDRKHNGSHQRMNIIKKDKLKIKPSDYDEIQRLYFDEDLSMTEIAKQYGCTSAVVCNLFKQLGLKARTKSENRKKKFKDLEFREANRRHCIEVYLNRRKTGTKPERQFAEYCKQKGIRFEEQYRKVGNAHPYDFFLPDYNLIVEIDGTYWHSKPEQQVKDARHVAEAVAKGYNIIRIDTTELNKNKGDFDKWICCWTKTIQK